MGETLEMLLKRERDERQQCERPSADSSGALAARTRADAKREGDEESRAEDATRGRNELEVAVAARSELARPLVLVRRHEDVGRGVRELGAGDDEREGHPPREDAPHHREATHRVGPVETREAAIHWARTWERGWREHDAAAIVRLYADGAFFQSHPFREHEVARVYVERVFAEEESAECAFGEPIVDADRAAVEWRGRTRLRDGGKEDLVGVSLLRFDADGLVVEQRDVWVER